MKPRMNIVLGKANSLVRKAMAIPPIPVRNALRVAL